MGWVDGGRSASSAESGALCIPTAAYAMPGGAGMAWRLICGSASNPLCELGWRSLGVLELTALPSIKEEHWVPMVQETDTLLIGGGDCLYLCYWMRQSGLADLLPSLRRETVYVGVSAGSMVVTPTSERPTTAVTRPPAAIERWDWLIFRCASAPGSREISGEFLGHPERLAARIPVSTYAIEDQTAIKVTDGTVEVVSEGTGSCLPPNTERLSGFAASLG